MKTYHRFILLFEGRTGSSLLGDLLNQNPRISFFGEKAGELFSEGWDAQRNWIETVCFRPDMLEDVRFKDTAEITGFKVKLREVASPEALKAFIEDNRLQVIYMTRTNMIKQVVSSVRAIDLFKDKGLYNISTNFPQEDVPGEYAISPDRFQMILEWLESNLHALDTYISSLNVDVYPLSYEQLYSDPEGSMDALCAFLKVAPASFKFRSRKITSDTLSDSVSNYEELRSLYHDTPHADMF